MKHDFEYNKRGLTRHLERMGLERKDRFLLERPWADRKEQISAYLRDSLLWGIEEMEAGRPIYALRALVQASGYAGFVGHDSITGDALNALKNAVEDVMPQEVGS